MFHFFVFLKCFYWRSDRDFARICSSPTDTDQASILNNLIPTFQVLQVKVRFKVFPLNDRNLRLVFIEINILFLVLKVSFPPENDLIRLEI
jgi:hypothetical protein